MNDICYVDDEDKVIGSGPINDYIKNGFAARIVRVFLVNNKGQLLLQQRSANIKVSANKWDQSAGGHVDAGESCKSAAIRELSEEMGIKNVDLKLVSKYFSKDNHPDGIRKRFNYVLIGEYEGEVKIDKEEVSAYKWAYLKEIDELIKTKPLEFTNGFITSYNKIKHLLKNLYKKNENKS